MVGVSPEYAAFLGRGITRGACTPMARILQGERIVEVFDLREDEGYRSGDAVPRAAVELGGLVALTRDREVLGAFAIARQEVRPFTEKQIALLQNFAAQAVIAMENARLINETREALDQQTATAEVLQVISRSTFGLVTVLDTVVSAAAQLCNADAGVITTREAEGFRIITTFAAEPEYDAAFRGRLIPAHRGTLSGRTALEGRVVHIPDMASDPEYTLTEAVTLGPYRSAIGVPLLRDDVVIGTINLARKHVRPFTGKQIELARTFADQAIIAIENSRMLTVRARRWSSRRQPPKCFR